MLPANRFVCLTLSVLLAAILYNCSPASSFGDREISIRNSSSQNVLVEIWDKESSHTLDVAPAVSVDLETFHRINAGESIVFPDEEIEGNYRADKSDRLFLYEVEVDSAYYQQLFDVAPGVAELTIRKEGEHYTLHLD